MTLAERVAEYVAANPGQTVDEIARSVTARTAEVRDVLLAGGFSSSLRVAYASDRARVYRVAPGAQDGQGRARRPSQCDRLLSILADGRWHNSADLHRQVFCVLHSRISELRRRGYVIERRGQGAGAEHYDYRLVEHVEASEAACPLPQAASDASDLLVGDTAKPDEASNTTTGQLSFGVAA